MRCEPGENERNTVAFFNREFRNRGQIFSLRFNRRSQNQTIRARDRFHSAVPLAHPRNDMAVIESDNQFHLHAQPRPVTLRRSE